MQHLGAFYESVDPGAAYNTLNAVSDACLFTSGVDMRVPSGLSSLIGAAVTGNDSSIARAQIQSPSLRQVVNIDVEPMINALVFGNPPEAIYHPRMPIPLVGDEALNFAVDSDPSSAVVHYGLVWFADGAQQEAQGQIYSVRATSACSLSAGAWVAGELTFNQVLPRGRYQVVGMRARGTNLVAARLNFRGQAFRPGTIALNAIGDQDHRLMRHGGMGVLGEFDTNTPPAIDCLGVTDSSQVYILDLIKVG
jgi:hypothetical protein